MIVSMFPGGFRVSCSKCGETTKLFMSVPTPLPGPVSQETKSLATTIKVECSYRDAHDIADNDLSTPTKVN